MEHNPETNLMSMSTHFKRKQAHDLLVLQKWHGLIFMIWIPLCIGCLIWSCLWADIQGENTKYTDYKDWQTCLTQADYSYIPLNATLAPAFSQISTIKPTLTNCVIGEVLSGHCTLPCVMNMSVDCFSAIKVSPPVVQNVALPTGHYLQGLSYLGVQTIIFSAIAHAALHKALRHPSWLVSTIALQVWFVVAIFTYYTVNPIFGVPTQTNSTLLTYLYYGHSFSKYKDLNNGDNHCQLAFNYVWGNLAMLVAIASTNFAGFLLACYGERIRYHSPNKKRYEPLKNTLIPCLLGILAVCFYGLILAGKMVASIQELMSIADFDMTIKEAGLQKVTIWFPQIWFPFVQPTLDIATILGIFCFMSILRGYTIQSISAFRAAFGCSLIYALSMYPSVVGGFQFYKSNDFTDFNSCWTYFQTAGVSSIFAYPDEERSKVYCQSFTLSLVGNAGLLIIMHFITIACYLTLSNNASRDSMEHEPVDFLLAAAADAARAQASAPPKEDMAVANPVGHYEPPMAEVQK